jgi:hypothetical protein
VISGKVKVISVGLPRTGTRSMYEAFQILGMTAVHQPAGQFQDWTGSFPHDRYMYPSFFRHVFTEGPEAIIESMFWRLLLMAFPDALIVLTSRDMNAWYASIAKHIDNIHSRDHHWNVNDIYAADRCHERLFGSRYPQRPLYTEAYHCHSLAVKHFCQINDRPCLEFDPTQGEWGNLPAYCGRPDPDEPFPHKNKTIWESGND